MPFTLIGATTRTGLLTTPLRDRFGVWQRLEYYEEAELQAIVLRSAGILGVRISDEAALQIAVRARGTPRVANRLLRRVRDFAEVRHQGEVTTDICLAALELFQVDAEGLDKLDRDILLAIVEKFDGGPVGLDTLSVALGEEADTIQDVYEPYLIMRGFLQAHAARSHRDLVRAIATADSSRRPRAARCSRDGGRVAVAAARSRRRADGARRVSPV